MHIKQFEYVQEIVHYGSITKAADNLYISQQALSDTLHHLENELGFKIFRRTNKGVVLTANGEKFIKDLETIMPTIYKWATYRDEKKQVKILLQFFIGDLLLDPSFMQKLQKLQHIELKFETTRQSEMIKQVTNKEICVALITTGTQTNCYQTLVRLHNSGNYKVVPLVPAERSVIGILMRAEEVNKRNQSFSLEDLANKTIVVNSAMLQAKFVKTLSSYSQTKINDIPHSVKTTDMVALQKNVITCLPQFIADKNIYVKQGDIVFLQPKEILEEGYACYLLYSTELENELEDVIFAIRSYFDEI